MSKLRLVLGALGLGALVALVAYQWFRPQSLNVATPVIGQAVQAVYAAGTVEAEVMLPIAPRVSARIVELLVDEGQIVESGQVLVRLEDAELRSTVEELEARLAFAQSEHQRQKQLLSKRVSTAESFERAESELRAASAALNTAKAKLSYLSLTAPGAGRIIRRDGEPGELLAVNQAVLWFAADGPLRISAEIDEEDIPLVQVGQQVLMRADAYSGKSFEGQVQSVTPMGDAVARSYRVRISFDRKLPFRIGMTVENNIIVGKVDNAMLIPASAIVRSGVWVLAAGVLESRKLELGVRGSQRVEVVSGLDKDDLVVIEPHSDFKPGQRYAAQIVQWTS